jgi:acyl carrier protein
MPDVLLSDTEIAGKVRAIVAEHLRRKLKEAPDSAVSAELELDSLDAAEMVLEVEEAFDIDLDLSFTVGEFIALVEAAVRARAGRA